MTGDSVLAVFGTAAGAVGAAIEVQRRLAAARAGAAVADPLRFRIGIHLGDVIEQADGSVFGDGVNIAARIEGLAAPDGIAVSQSVQEAVAGRVPVRCTDLGPQRLKNIARPLRVFRLEPDDVPASGAGTVDGANRSGPAPGWRAMRAGIVVAVLVLGVAVAAGWMARHGRTSVAPATGAPESVGQAIVGKSVAVLAFEGVGGDADNDSFATGLSDELITALSRVPGLKVAARTSAYHFKGRQAAVDEIARRLGVYYVVTGTVRKAGTRLKIAVQLVNAADASPVWSREYDRELQDIFAVQAEIARSVAANLQVRIGETELAAAAPPISRRAASTSGPGRRSPRTRPATTSSCRCCARPCSAIPASCGRGSC